MSASRKWLSLSKYKHYELKKMLSDLPPDDAFKQFCDQLNIDYPIKLRPMKASSMAVFAKYNAKKYIEIAASGIDFMNRAPKVIGEGDHRDLHCRTRTQYVACFENARITAESCAIEYNDEVLFDFEPWELARIEEDFELDPKIFRSCGDNIWFIDQLSQKEDLKIKCGFMLTGLNTHAFGHLIIEYLCKYVSALLSNCIPPMSLIIDKRMPPTHIQAVQMLLPKGWEIIPIAAGTTVRVNKLWCASTLFYVWISEQPHLKNCWDYWASPSDRFLPCLKYMIQKFYTEKSESQHNKRIYLSRKYQNRRILINSEAIEQIAKSNGFEIIYPEKLSFASQIEVIRSAKYILAPEGSSIYLAFFARPNTNLLILDSPYLEGQATGTHIMEELGVGITVLTGTCMKQNQLWNYFSDYKISEQKFSTYLRRWLNNN